MHHPFQRARTARPATSYYLLTAGLAYANALAFTLVLVYYVVDVGLSPLQMVLAGTVLEVTLLVFEIPTGVVADLISRRLSIVIGITVMAVGFGVQAVHPSFAAVLVGQAIWGFGFTFISGADDAWITDEVGESNVAPIFTRAQQIYLGATVLGTVSAGAVGLASLRLPLLIAAVIALALAAVLAVTMREDNFAPAPREDRATFAHMSHTFKTGIAVARKRPVVRSFLIISLFVGLSSEAFDRLWTVRIVNDFTLPRVGTSDPAVWFTVFALISTTLALVTSVVINRVSLEQVNNLHPNRLLAFLVLVQIVGIVALGLFGNLWVALAGLWLRDAAAALAQPVQAAWLNRNLDSQSRATVLSIDGQANAIGQVAGGPPLGALAGRAGLRTAIVASGLLLSPAVVAYLRLRPNPDPVTEGPLAEPGVGPNSSPVVMQTHDRDELA